MLFQAKYKETFAQYTGDFFFIKTQIKFVQVILVCQVQASDSSKYCPRQQHGFKLLYTLQKPYTKAVSIYYGTVTNWVDIISEAIPTTLFLSVHSYGVQNYWFSPLSFVCFSLYSPYCPSTLLLHLPLSVLASPHVSVSHNNSIRTFFSLSLRRLHLL